MYHALNKGQKQILCQNNSARIYSEEKQSKICNSVYFRLCIDLMHIPPPVTAEGYDGSHQPRYAECKLTQTRKKKVPYKLQTCTQLFRETDRSARRVLLLSYLSLNMIENDAYRICHDLTVEIKFYKPDLKNVIKPAFGELNITFLGRV